LDAVSLRDNLGGCKIRDPQDVILELRNRVGDGLGRSRANPKQHGENNCPAYELS